MTEDRLVELSKSIAALHVEGLKICALDDIPVAVNARDCPIIYPDPYYLLVNYSTERQSFGGGSAALWTDYTDMTYILCYAPVGSDRGIGQPISSMAGMIREFAAVVQDIDTIDGAEDVQVINLTINGTVSDPSGNVFHGGRVTIRIMQFVH